MILGTCACVLAVRLNQVNGPQAPRWRVSSLVIAAIILYCHSTVLETEAQGANPCIKAHAFCGTSVLTGEAPGASSCLPYHI